MEFWDNAQFFHDFSRDPGQLRRGPQPTGMQEPQRQDMLARALAEPVLLVEVAGAFGVHDPLVAVEAEPGLFRLVAVPDAALEGYALLILVGRDRTSRHPR